VRDDAVIHIEDLGKRYLLGAAPGLRWPWRRREPPRELWALRGVNLDVARGEIVGIVGANGAGKSTLLKILSRITAPTQGRVVLDGRVGSLLEVGTGFHPELSGRENVFLNGVLLGMRRHEVQARLDAILDFAQVNDFLDTPVKHYSSGMRMRLAFAVAAHLASEILIVDEVLAVGDAAFQRRCLGKMDEVAKSGRTVLFVSHNLNALSNLCTRAVWLREGQLAQEGVTPAVVAAYLASQQEQTGGLRSGVGRFELARASRNTVEARGRAQVFTSLQLRDARGLPTDVARCGDGLTFELGYAHAEPLARPTFGIVVHAPGVGRVAFLQTALQHGTIDKLPPQGSVACNVPRLPLAPGRYELSFGVSTLGEQLDFVERCVELEVQPGDYYGTGRLPKENQGLLLVDARWSLP
jgi:lipopolysaccharide transport system ATP-binding protein